VLELSVTMSKVNLDLLFSCPNFVEPWVLELFATMSKVNHGL
jgi:hypothetical protein